MSPPNKGVDMAPTKRRAERVRGSQRDGQAAETATEVGRLESEGEI